MSDRPVVGSFRWALPRVALFIACVAFFFAGCAYALTVGP